MDSLFPWATGTEARGWGDSVRLAYMAEAMRMCGHDEEVRLKYIIALLYVLITFSHTIY